MQFRLPHPQSRLVRSRVEMRHRKRRMHPRIRPPGPHHLVRRTEQLAQSPFQHLLHRRGIGLPLPTVVSRSVIGQFDEKSRHAKTSLIQNPSVQDNQNSRKTAPGHSQARRKWRNICKLTKNTYLCTPHKVWEWVATNTVLTNKHAKHSGVIKLQDDLRQRRDR